MGLHAGWFGMSPSVLRKVDIKEGKVDKTMLEQSGGVPWVSNSGKPH